MCMDLKWDKVKGQRGKYMTKFEQIINGKIKEAYSIEDLQKKLKPIKEYPFQDTIKGKLEGEHWRPYKNLKMIKGQYNKNHYIGKEYHNIKEMKVSDLGRVKVTYDDNKEEILHQSDDIEIGYLRLPKFPGFGNVYRLVAETWLTKDNDKRNIVHHIDNDGYNNKAENLIWVTAEEHAKIHS